MIALSQFLGLNRNTVMLLAAILLIAVGEEMWMRFVPKYLEVLGASVFVIGAYDGLKTVLGAVYAYPGGILVDRWGHRMALSLFTVVSIAGYVVLLVVAHWAAVLGAMFLFLAWSTLSLPATFTLIGESLPSGKHAMGIGVQSLIRRLPVMAGPILGGILIDRYGMVQGVRYGVIASLLLATFALALQQQIAIQRTGTRLKHGFGHILASADPFFRRLLFSDILVRLCERLPFAWVVIYAMDHIGTSATEVGILIAVEMTAAIACYLPASYLADRYGKEPFVVATFAFFALFPMALMAAQSFWPLVVAFAIRGLKEFGEPARKALILAYAPQGVKGQAVGAYYLVRDTIASTGSLLGAALWRLGPQVNFGTAALVGALGTAVYVATMPRAGRK